MFKHVIRYSPDADFEELWAMWQEMERLYGKGAFLIIPDTCTYEQFDLETMRKLYEDFGKILEEVERENSETSAD